jgi:RNA polymerase sigma factor (TIGR02999 family)
LTNPTHEITKLLRAWNKGDQEALDKLIPLVDRELKKIAKHYMHLEKPGHILQPTALVNEVLIKLIRENTRVENRRHFYALVAHRMRRILIDYARKRKRAEFAEINVRADEKSTEILRLEKALKELATINKRAATIVEHRFFIGLKLGEIAKLLGTSKTTVERDWRFARAVLKKEMTVDQTEPGSS